MSERSAAAKGRIGGYPKPLEGLEDISRDPAEEACYDIQNALWNFQKAIADAATPERLDFIDKMVAETKHRLELVIVAVGARQTEIEK